MAQIQWEEHFHDLDFVGTCDIYEVPSADAPKTLIRTNQSWGARFQWSASGTLLDNLDPEHKWYLRLFLERWGPSEWGGPGQWQREVAYVQGDNNYDEQLEISAGNVPVGVYKVAASVILVNRRGGGWNPFPIAGLAEGPFVEFYQP